MVYLRTWYLVPGTVQVSTTVFPVPGVLVPGTAHQVQYLVPILAILIISCSVYENDSVLDLPQNNIDFRVPVPEHKYIYTEHLHYIHCT